MQVDGHWFVTTVATFYEAADDDTEWNSYGMDVVPTQTGVTLYSSRLVDHPSSASNARPHCLALAGQSVRPHDNTKAGGRGEIYEVGYSSS